MIPFFRIEESYCIGLGAEASYGCMECGHNALSVRVTFLTWFVSFGIEFK